MVAGSTAYKRVSIDEEPIGKFGGLTDTNSATGSNFEGWGLGFCFKPNRITGREVHSILLKIDPQRLAEFSWTVG